MRKHTQNSFFILLLLFLLSACGNDPVRDDLIHYWNKELKPLGAEEKDVVTRFASVTGTNYTSDAVLLDALTKKILPEYSDFITKLEAIHPQTKEVQKIHKEYIKAAHMQMDAFQTYVKGIQDESSSIIIDGNRTLAKANQLFIQLQSDLNALEKKHNVKLDRK